MDGSTMPAVKRALVEKLKERFGANDVAVSYQAPEVASDLTNDQGELDAVWLDSAEFEAPIEIPNMMPSPHHLDEHYDFTVSVQSLRPKSDGWQEVTDQRASEMLGEVLGVFASSPNLVPLSTHVLLCEIKPQGRTVEIGIVGQGPGHGTRYDVTVNVHARLALS